MGLSLRNLLSTGARAGRRIVGTAMRTQGSPLMTGMGFGLAPGQRTAALGQVISTAFPAAAPYVSALLPALSTGVTDSSGGDVVINPEGGIGDTTPVVFGGAVAAGARMAPAVFNAIIKLSQRLGGAGRSVAGYGARVWAQLSSWAAKNPGVSLVSLLVSLGLTVEEAAHFIAWGTAHKRRKRGRGISSRDLRTTRRTMRKVISMTHQLRELCGGVPHMRRARRVHHARP